MSRNERAVAPSPEWKMSDSRVNETITASGPMLPLAMAHPPSIISNLRSVLHRPPEAATYVGLSVSTLAKQRLRGDGPKFVRLSPRAIGYLQVDLDAWLAEKRFGSTSEYPAVSTRLK
jgi:predicted DNA-binding transcriptional regulator AlpA